jgi:hypothetical protein
MKHDINKYKVGSVVRLEYGACPYGIISSINRDNGQVLVKFAQGPRVYKFTSLKLTHGLEDGKWVHYCD